MFAAVPLRIPRLAAALAVAGCAVTVVGGLTVWGATLPSLITVHCGVFYAITAVAYLTLPFIRRGDILMVAGWLVLASGVGPCVLGQELSAPNMFADMAGVAAAAAPIYIARLRQLAQGDVRPPRRRQTDLQA